MKIYRSLTELPSDFGPAALTIGNFDGVHTGHRQILRRVRAVAEERGLKASALTFDPHPAAIVAPGRVPQVMTTPVRRCELMAEEGIAQVLILPFDFDIAELTPEQFVAELLVAKLGVQAVLVGHNFRFGHNQTGNVEVLRALGARFGFTVEVVSAVRCRGREVSSSTIRQLVRRGEMACAARLQERPFAMEGEVVSGRGVGSKQTVPTLNLATRTEPDPATGVYITRTVDLDAPRTWESITNIGYRPTFGDSTELTIETFLLQPLTGHTPRHIRVEFLRRVRGERKFDSPEALRAQILRDVGRAQAFFRRIHRWVTHARTR